MKKFLEYGSRSPKALLVSIIVVSFASGFGAFQAIDPLRPQASDHWVGAFIAVALMFVAISNSRRLLRLIAEKPSATNQP